MLIVYMGAEQRRSICKIVALNNRLQVLQLLSNHCDNWIKTLGLEVDLTVIDKSFKKVTFQMDGLKSLSRINI